VRALRCLSTWATHVLPKLAGPRRRVPAGWQLPHAQRRGADLATTLGLGSFATHTVTPVTNCAVVPRDLDLVSAALISCGVSTGVGAVLNVAGLRPGDSVAVIGLGGVGAAAVLGAVLGGASRIVAVDIHEHKRAMAAELGATDFVHGREDDPRAAIMRLTGGRGVDRILLTADTVRPEMYALAVESLAPGGVAVQVGASTSGLDHLPISPHLFVTRQISFTGTVYGGMDPERDALRYAELVMAGRLPLDRLVSAHLSPGGDQRRVRRPRRRPEPARRHRLLTGSTSRPTTAVRPRS
jgi:S-(hydroxymethyl)glutathione dehydrogenase/alcohol dehydrogenase